MGSVSLYGHADRVGVEEMNQELSQRRVLAAGRWRHRVSEEAPGASDAARLALVFEGDRKSIGAADGIWFFLEFLGIHRFYLGRTGSGVGLLLLFIVGLFLLPVGIGVLLWLALGVWWLIDVASIPGIVGYHDVVLLDRLSGALLGRI